MKRSTKLSLMIAVCSIAIGALLFLFAWKQADGDPKNWGTTRAVQNSQTVSQTFSNISIHTAASDIRFLPSQDGTCRVDCPESSQGYHTVEVIDDTLQIQWVHKRDIHFGVFLHEDETITVYLPETAYEALTLETVSGDIGIAQPFQFTRASLHTTSGDIYCSASITETLNAQTTSGDLELTSLRCKELSVESISGEIELENVVAQQIQCNTTSGDMELERCDAETLTLNSVSGDISGALLREKVYSCSTVSGDVRVPKNQSGGVCTVNTVSGDIKFR